MTRNDVLIPFLVLMSVVTLILIFMQVYGPYEWQREPVDVDPYGNVLVSSGKCTGNDQTLKFALSLIGVNGLVLLLALFQAYQARSITVEYSESTYIGYAMVSMFQLFLMGAPLLFLLNDSQTTFFYGSIAIVIGTSFTVLGFMFVPKMRLLYLERNPTADRKSSLNIGSSSDSSGTR